MEYLLGLAALVAMALLVRVIYLRIRPRPLIEITIKLVPDGRHEVTVKPPDMQPQLLALTALCYAAKIRWLLTTEPPEVLNAYKEAVGEALDFWPKTRGPLIDAMPLGRKLKDSLTPDEWAVSGGEVFVVRGQPALGGGVSVTNDLPRPGLAVNIGWNVIVLFDYLSRTSDAYSDPVVSG